MITPEEMLLDARQLLNVVPHEGRRRTVISRAYYAAFHFLNQHPCCNQYERTSGRGTHQDLLEYLGSSPEPNVQSAAELLQSLYTRRIEADYRLSNHVLRGTEVHCVEDAAYIIEETLVEYEEARDRRTT